MQPYLLDTVDDTEAHSSIQLILPNAQELQVAVVLRMHTHMHIRAASVLVLVDDRRHSTHLDFLTLCMAGVLVWIS